MAAAHQRARSSGACSSCSSPTPKACRSAMTWWGQKTGQERESALRLATGQPGSLLFADGGFWGRELHSALELIDVELITPSKHRLGERPASEIAKARIRL